MKKAFWVVMALIFSVSLAPAITGGENSLNNRTGEPTLMAKKKDKKDKKKKKKKKSQAEYYLA
jgi:hypothetical protein